MIYFNCVQYLMIFVTKMFSYCNELIRMCWDREIRRQRYKKIETNGLLQETQRAVLNDCFCWNDVMILIMNVFAVPAYLLWAMSIVQFCGMFRLHFLVCFNETANVARMCVIVIIFMISFFAVFMCMRSFWCAIIQTATHFHTQLLHVFVIFLQFGPISFLVTQFAFFNQSIFRAPVCKCHANKDLKHFCRVYFELREKCVPFCHLPNFQCTLFDL